MKKYLSQHRFLNSRNGWSHFTEELLKSYLSPTEKKHRSNPNGENVSSVWDNTAQVSGVTVLEVEGLQPVKLSPLAPFKI